MQLNDFISKDANVLGGQVVFKGTRVPVETLFDYLESGISLDDFLKDFSTVKREQAVGVLEIANNILHLPELNLPDEIAAL